MQHHGEGIIMEKESWRRNHGGGLIEEESWRSLEASGDIWEASGRHLGGIWEASGRLWASSGSSLRPPGLRERLGGKMCQNICVFCQRKWRKGPFRVDGSDPTLTVYRACALLATARAGRARKHSTQPLRHSARTPSV